jgi:alpha,alpha-trehalase
MLPRPEDADPAPPGLFDEPLFPPDAGELAASEGIVPIADHGFISDRETSALVAPDGSVDWMCVPRPDSPSVFGAILDPRAGSFRLGPADLHVPAGRHYVPGTNVLETTWESSDGWLLVRDALVIAPSDGAVDGHRAAHVLARTATCIGGEIDLELRCAPRFDYGMVPAVWEPAGGSALVSGRGAGPELVLAGNRPLEIEADGVAVARVHMRRGDRVSFSLAWGRDAAAPWPRAAAEDLLWRTVDYWRRWISQGTFPDHPWRGYLQRSALLLKGLTYEPTGAMIAAPTTSLPETPGGARNWDYRYCWIRDSAYTLWALHSLGFHAEADAFFAYVRACVVGGARLQVVYGVGGERVLPERELPHLRGYGGARPVRIGNAAFEQEQHDAWGALLDSVYLYHRVGEPIDDGFWTELEAQVEEAVATWRAPDRGLWEVRGEPQHFTVSKIMCWVACDRGARLAESTGHPALAARWRANADEIRADVLARGVSDRGVLRQHYDSDALDASALLAILMRFLSPDDPIAKATVFAIADELTVDGFVLRYRTEETDDGMWGHEGTFAMCSFWLVSALVEIGEVGRARDLCEKLLSFASPLGLYAEELDPVSGRHLRNFPQAFTHLAQINAIVHLVLAEAAAAQGD